LPQPIGNARLRVSQGKRSFMDLQHVNVKLLVRGPQEVDLEPLIPIFHSWIQDQVCPELLLDVADYRHVSAGPGVVVIGHQADYSVDNTDGRLGIRYNRKATLDGTNQDRLEQSMQSALSACQQLESDPRLEGKLRFNGQELEVFVNDRLVAPNNEATRETLSSEFSSFFQKLFRGGEYSLSYSGDPRRLFSVFVKTSRPFAVADLLDNLVCA
jgi:hypothetical protein